MIDDFDWEVESLRLQTELAEARALLRQLLSILDINCHVADEVREYLRIEE